jgi:hypothetical protein
MILRVRRYYRKRCNDGRRATVVDTPEPVTESASSDSVLRKRLLKGTVLRQRSLKDILI